MSDDEYVKYDTDAVDAQDKGCQTVYEKEFLEAFWEKHHEMEVFEGVKKTAVESFKEFGVEDFGGLVSDSVTDLQENILARVDGTVETTTEKMKKKVKAKIVGGMKLVKKKASGANKKAGKEMKAIFDKGGTNLNKRVDTLHYTLDNKYQLYRDLLSKTDSISYTDKKNRTLLFESIEAIQGLYEMTLTYNPPPKYLHSSDPAPDIHSVEYDSMFNQDDNKLSADDCLKHFFKQRKGSFIVLTYKLTTKSTDLEVAEKSEDVLVAYDYPMVQALMRSKMEFPFKTIKLNEATGWLVRIKGAGLVWHHLYFGYTGFFLKKSRYFVIKPYGMRLYQYRFNTMMLMVHMEQELEKKQQQIKTKLLKTISDKLNQTKMTAQKKKQLMMKIEKKYQNTVGKKLHQLAEDGMEEFEKNVNNQKEEILKNFLDEFEGEESIDEEAEDGSKIISMKGIVAKFEISDLIPFVDVNDVSKILDLNLLENAWDFFAGGEGILSDLIDNLSPLPGVKTAKDISKQLVKRCFGHHLRLIDNGKYQEPGPTKFAELLTAHLPKKEKQKGPRTTLPTTQQCELVQTSLLQEQKSITVTFPKGIKKYGIKIENYGMGVIVQTVEEGGFFYDKNVQPKMVVYSYTFKEESFQLEAVEMSLLSKHLKEEEGGKITFVTPIIVTLSAGDYLLNATFQADRNLKNALTVTGITNTSILWDAGIRNGMVVYSYNFCREAIQIEGKFPQKETPELLQFIYDFKQNKDKQDRTIIFISPITKDASAQSIRIDQNNGNNGGSERREVYNPNKHYWN